MAMHLGSGRPMSEINVTPMVDVMLVLLIIFMVAAPMIQQGVPVELPQAKAQALDAEDKHAVLTITKAHQIFLGDAEIPYAELRERLRGNVKLQAEKQLFLHADRGLDYGFVVDVMSVLKECGVDNLGMVTDPLAPPRKGAG